MCVSEIQPMYSWNTEQCNIIYVYNTLLGNVINLQHSLSNTLIFIVLHGAAYELQLSRSCMIYEYFVFFRIL